VGVWASRSPYRPNPLGLSCVELEGIDGMDLLVCVAADVDQCFYDIVKRMVVVIVDYQFATAVVQQIQVLFFFFFVLAVVFHNLSIG
jgi:hypothetical protein